MRGDNNGWRLSIGIVIVAACFVWVVPSFASYGEIANALTGALATASGPLVAMAAVVVIANLISPSLTQTAALPGLGLSDALAVDWASTTVTNVVPAGSAAAIGLTWAWYRSLSFTAASITRSIVVTGVADQLVKLGTPLPAVLWLLSEQTTAPLLVQSAVVGGILFAAAVGLSVIMLTGPRAARTVGLLANRTVNPLVDRIQEHRIGRGGRATDGGRSGGAVDWPNRLDRIRSDVHQLLRERGGRLALATLAGHANLYLLLMVSLRLAGVDSDATSWAAGLAAFAFGRLATALPLTPGGLGVAEVSLIGALSLVGTASDAALAAAVLLYRLASYLLPTVLGLPALLWLRRRSATGDGSGPDSGA